MPQWKGTMGDVPLARTGGGALPYNQGFMVTTATPTIAPPRRRSVLRTLLAIVLVLVVLLVLAVAGGILWFRHAAYSALPQLDGTIKVAGLSGPVRVVRDAQGVPHI